MTPIRRIVRSLGPALVALALSAVWPVDGAEPQSGLVAQGMEALDHDKVDDALALFEKAVADDPKDPTALTWLGSTQTRKARTASLFAAPGWVRKGFITLDEAVERFPNAYIVYLVRGITAVRVPDLFKKAPVAVKDLNTVLALRDKNPDVVPDNVLPSVYLNLGRAYKKNGQPAEARAAWEKGKKLYPSADDTRAIEKELGGL